MVNTSKTHTNDLYSTLLNLSRNIFFYKRIGLPDTFETRIYLMFIHFSVMMIVFKNKGKKFNQKSYDSLFHNIENNLREMGFGDVSVNKKMKDYVNLLFSIIEIVDIWDTFHNSKKNSLIANYINIDTHNDLFVKYFDKFGEFLAKNSLKIFTKDILELKF